MADNMIELVASLNVDDSAKQINTVDIPKLQKKIEGIKIKCELDTEGISSIQSQLANIKINAPQIDLGVGGGSELINNVSHIVDNVEDKIEELRKALAEKFKVGIDKIVTNTVKNASGQINSFSLDLTKLSGEVEKFNYKVSRTKDGNNVITSVKPTGSRDSDKGAIQLLERATKAANTLERQIINLKAAADDVSAPRPITSQESIDKVAQAYKNAETAVGNLRTANASTFEELNNEAKKAVDELNNVIKAQRNADTAATKLRAKPIEVVKADELSNLDKFVATISNSAIPDVTNLTRRVEELRSELSEVNDKQGLVDYLNKFANVESDFKALVAQAKAVKGALRDLDNLSNNALFQKNKSDLQVSSTLSDIENIRKEYGQLFAEIGNAKTPEDLQKISNKLAELKPQFDKVVNSANQFKTAIKVENIDEGLANRIKRLTADINSYASANKRAVESTKQMTSGKSFADEWSRITSVMAKGADLTDRELKDLSADMAVFRKEAQAAGLAGASAFEKFGNAFKLVSTYISANQVINMVTRNIREAVDELKAVDDRLTEISKTSDRTAESLRNLGNASFDTASKYGRTASDYLLGVQEMSRAGFGEKASEDMAELSVLAQAAGDMTADLANEYLIATNAAYQYGGSVDKLNDSLDRQNYVTNHYALSMSDLAEATKIAASQAAQSGIGIDEMTAALSTMISTTQQGGEIAARSLRGILMNIQQVKGEVGDGEADITAESLSKYEKAAADLGVSLKEVRNGAVSLRDPMIVLDELATAFNKEADDSIKKANLISAIGGKYRGNQLSALLTNWDTYKDILNTFNSEQAVGSALSEAEKSANNWAGSLNKVKNSWSELVNSFINSDNAITVIQSVDKIIQNLTDSAATGGLKTLSDAITSLIKLVGDLTDKFGTLPTLLTSIAAVGSFKGVGAFGSIGGLIDKLPQLSEKLDSIQQLRISGVKNKEIQNLREYVELLKDGIDEETAFKRTMAGVSSGAQKQAESYTQLFNSYKTGKISLQQYEASMQSLVEVERIATVESKALSVGLNLIGNIAIAAAITGIVKLFQYLTTFEERSAKAAEDLSNKLKEANDSLEEENAYLEDLIKQYTQLYSSNKDITTIKGELSSIQDEIIKKYGEEADAIDVVNGKYSEEIKEIKKLGVEKAKQYLSENQADIRDARKALSQTHELGENRSRYVGGFGKDYVLNSDAAIVIEAEGVGDWDKETRKVWENIEGIVRLTHDNLAGDQIAITGTLEEQYETLIAMRDAYGTIENYDGDRYKQLDKEAKKRKELLDTFKKTDETAKESEKIVEAYNVPEDIEKQYDTLINKIVSLNAELASEDNAVRAYGLTQEISDVKQEINELAADYPRLKDEADSVFKSLDSNVINSIQSVGDLREAWFKSLDDIQKGSLKNIDIMKSALQSVMNGDTLSADSFWQLSEFDTDHILNGVKMVGDEFQLTEEQIISLKDTYIKKQMESVQLRQTELKQLKSAEEMEARQLQVALDNWKFADKNLNNPKYRAEFEDLQNRLKTAKENATAYGDEWNLNAILLRQYNASLGNTADLIQAAQSRAEKLSEAFVGRIDKVIDGINDQKDALAEEKEVLQDQLDILEAQADEIKGIIEDYEKVADVVKNTIQDEISAIEESYNKQIEALKAQNEEREEAISLTEKLNNLNNAKNNKVVTYTEAGGFQYGVNKEAVNKAQQEYDKALIDSQIAKLEKERDSATAGFEEYAKLWENATKKATKAEEEELAARILGADWREKISEQDVEIFETYEQKYDEYGVSLNNITNIEIANVKKSIEAKDKEIKAKEDLLEEWQKYKTNVQNYVNDLKNTNKEYEDSIENITLTESSNLDERLANFERFKTEYESMINRILELQDGVGDIEVNASVKMDDFTDGIKEVVEGIGTVSEKLAEAIKELGKMPSINSAGDVKYYQATGYQHYASGGVNSSTGLAWLDGTRSKPEVVLNNQDATKLYNLLHSMPASAAQMFSSPLTRFAGLKSGSTSQSSAINITGNTINLPNVRDPQQFAREMERYLQTTLTESQIIPPRS